MTAITTIAMLPVLSIVLLTTLELGSLRVVATRARAAADLAVLVAVDDQDDAELALSGRLRPSGDAAAVARAVFAENLEPIAPTLGAAPGSIAAAAIVRVEDAPPTVRIAARVPVRTPILGVLLFRPITEIGIVAGGGAR